MTGRPRDIYRTRKEIGRVNQLYLNVADYIAIRDAVKSLGINQIKAGELMAILMRKAVEIADKAGVVNVKHKGAQSSHARMLFAEAVFAVIVANLDEIAKIASEYAKVLVAQEKQDTQDRHDIAMRMKQFIKESTGLTE